ncbi:DUF1956 domain-containing protein [Paramixta manurensis]|uniref:DUF1956 domain-containing protein n=1 Tax=Paramixta manurensis TaxID=2740817 RepID=A0A6M8U6M9_9GAMM|nr:DUF1956 domain-containing protein [Erwiniaceae bacterium PD-1]
MCAKKSKPLRHPPEGGYARGDETRQRIIDAAIQVFGEQGFDAATTRQIAIRAGVNPPALQYYFENKEGVYYACIEWMAEESCRYFQPTIEKINRLNNHEIDADACIELFCQLLDVMLERVFNTTIPQGKILFHARAQVGQGPADAFRLMRERISGKLNCAAASLVARVSGAAVHDELTQIRTMTLMGQAVIFHLTRHSMLDQLGWEEVNAERLTLLKTTLRVQCRTLMESWRAASQ